VDVYASLVLGVFGNEAVNRSMANWSLPGRASGTLRNV
jgi:hypothetical protein